MPHQRTRDERLASLLTQFDGQKAKYDEFEVCLNNLLTQIVKGSRVSPHDISSRTKDRDSFIGKIRTPGKEYFELADVTDLVGLRITTYFESEVDQIKRIIEREFDIDEGNSIDKRKLHDPDRFGYMSLHYVVSLKKNRLNLPEYSVFKGMKAEIQIRSILQHTWAEIEHDLGYKSKYTIPKDITRRFYQLASLLELADREFLEIRQHIRDYENRVLECLERDDKEIEIDKNSVAIITEHDKGILALDSAICAVTGAELKSNHDFSENVADMLLWLGIETADDLFAQIEQHKEKIPRFADRWIQQKNYKVFNHGISIMYICYILLAEEGNVHKINKFARIFSLGKYVQNFSDQLLTIHGQTVLTMPKQSHTQCANS